MGRRVIKKLEHQGMPFECLLHDAALHTRAAPVDEPHLAQADGMCLVEVLFDNRRNVARRESVKVERAVYGQSKRVLVVERQGAAGLS